MNTNRSPGRVSRNCRRKSGRNDNFAQRKRRKLSEKLKITDINHDCLKNILENLDIGDLLNVANSNKWLKSAAASVFGRKFSLQNVQFTDIYPKYGAVFERDGTIFVGGLKPCLHFLRCFGESVKKLNVPFVDSTKKHHFAMDE